MTEAAPPSEIPISIVAALADNGVIGIGGDLPWRLSSDLKRFKALTLGKPIIMGRKTFDSIGRPLPGRENIVVTRQSDCGLAGARVASGLDEALRMASEFARRSGAEEIAVIGGAEIYRQALPHASRLHLTFVRARPEGDVRFPELNWADWRETFRERPARGPRDEFDFEFATYARIG